MNKVLLVSGSNRRGNTEYLLLKLKGVIKNSELLNIVLNTGNYTEEQIFSYVWYEIKI